MKELLKVKIKSSIFYLLFKNKANKNKCEIGKPLILKNTEFINLSSNVIIKDNYRIECYKSFNNEKLNPRLNIEENVIIGYNFSALVSDNIIIGKDTILASNVLLTTHNHGMDPEISQPYHKQSLKLSPIKIGEGCWIGERVIILPGVTIGNKSVVAANSVVNQNVPDYSIVAGSPARVVKKYNFDKHIWEKV